MHGRGARRCTLMLPGEGWPATGGYRYDRRVADGLRARGWSVERLSLPGDYPWPDDAAVGAAQAAVDRLPDGETVIADGLAFGALPAIAQAAMARLRWIALVHHPLHLETGLAPDRSRLAREREAAALAGARRILVTSEATARDVAAMGLPPSCIVVAEPGTDPAPLARLHRAPGDPAPPGTAQRFLCVASLTPRKDHATLLQALAPLPRGSWTLDLVGSTDRDPPTAAALRALAQQLGIDDAVRWHGEVDDASLQAAYDGASALVLASRHEGYGMAVAEALARGLPVIASDAGALAATLPGDAGLRVPAGDAPALAQALRRWCDDAGLRAACAAGAARARALLPTWEDTVDTVEAVLEAVRHPVPEGASR